VGIDILGIRIDGASKGSLGLIETLFFERGFALLDFTTASLAGAKQGEGEQETDEDEGSHLLLQCRLLTS
jgi:hypothetical protein